MWPLGSDRLCLKHSKINTIKVVSVLCLSFVKIKQILRSRLLLRHTLYILWPLMNTETVTRGDLGSCCDFTSDAIAFVDIGKRLVKHINGYFINTRDLTNSCPPLFVSPLALSCARRHIRPEVNIRVCRGRNCLLAISFSWLKSCYTIKNKCHRTTPWHKLQ